MVVNSDQACRYVGHLIVTFDEEGRIIKVDPRSGPVATTREAVAALDRVLGRPLTPPARVQRIFDNLRATPIIREQFEVIGTTAAVLNGDRAAVRSREPNWGRLTADSTLWYARQQYPGEDVTIALKNGGGIRASILGPAVTKLAVGEALAFDNKIAVVRLTAAELIAVMENAVSRVAALDGRFPQVAGVYLEFDATRPGVSDQVRLENPSRVKTLHVVKPGGTRDGYRALKVASEARSALRTGVGERQIPVEYIKRVLNGKVDLKEPLDSPRVQGVQQRQIPEHSGSLFAYELREICGVSSQQLIDQSGDLVDG